MATPFLFRGEYIYAMHIPHQSRSKAVVCVSTPRMYPRSGYFLVTSNSDQTQPILSSMYICSCCYIACSFHPSPFSEKTTLMYTVQRCFHVFFHRISKWYFSHRFTRFSIGLRQVSLNCLIDGSMTSSWPRQGPHASGFPK